MEILLCGSTFTDRDSQLRSKEYYAISVSAALRSHFVSYFPREDLRNADLRSFRKGSLRSVRF